MEPCPVAEVPPIPSTGPVVAAPGLPRSTDAGGIGIGTGSVGVNGPDPVIVESVGRQSGDGTAGCISHVQILETGDKRAETAVFRDVQPVAGCPGGCVPVGREGIRQDVRGRGRCRWGRYQQGGFGPRITAE